MCLSPEKSELEFKKYSGGFQEDQAHGLGIMKYLDGSSFKGEFRNGQRFEGTFISKDGDEYTG